MSEFKTLEEGDVIHPSDEIRYMGDLAWVGPGGASGQPWRKWYGFIARRCVSPGEGWAFVEEGKTIKDGDEYREQGNWKKVPVSAVGNTINEHRVRRFRRRKPDDMDGWRLLVPGETIEGGDEFRYSNGKWCPSGDKGRIYGENEKIVYRRKAKLSIEEQCLAASVAIIEQCREASDLLFRAAGEIRRLRNG